MPAEASSQNVTITAVDKFNDVAAIMITVDISGGIFVDKDIAPLNATIGEPFSFDVSTAFANPAEADISVSIVPETPCLSYDSKTFILSGEVPESAAASSVTVTLSANPKLGLAKRATDTKSFTINLVPPSSAGGSYHVRGRCTQDYANINLGSVWIWSGSRAVEDNEGITAG